MAWPGYLITGTWKFKISVGSFFNEFNLWFTVNVTKIISQENQYDKRKIKFTQL